MVPAHDPISVYNDFELIDFTTRPKDKREEWEDNKHFHEGT